MRAASDRGYTVVKMCKVFPSSAARSLWGPIGANMEIQQPNSAWVMNKL